MKEESVPSISLFRGVLLSIALRPTSRTAEKLLLKDAPLAKRVRRPMTAAPEAKKIARPYASHNLAAEYV